MSWWSTGSSCTGRSLRPRWDRSVWLDVPFATTYARMARRDGCDPDPLHPANRRYLEGQRIYLREHHPERLADVVVDNSDPGRPRLLRGD
ncbi:hypothetical protein GCM10025868_01520 [Angustibacter aerolatus]|uniref:Uridine kinase n=1 Tax=Angustibacter aerolatus TaxID=1162965 RepID=A0ABQ6JDC7_9ACTN|nr:hypothetical protein [Angustibacter aerolatus]GMA84902.1 hypothetical protein GCM10025868_01520 [Angustibacter aerolatus]